MSVGGRSETCPFTHPYAEASAGYSRGVRPSPLNKTRALAVEQKGHFGPNGKCRSDLTPETWSRTDVRILGKIRTGRTDIASGTTTWGRPQAGMVDVKLIRRDCPVRDSCHLTKFLILRILYIHV